MVSSQWSQQTSSIVKLKLVLRMLLLCDIRSGFALIQSYVGVKLGKVRSLQLITMTFCCCRWLRTKVGAVKLSLTTVLAKTANGFCLMLSPCHLSLSFGLDDKDNPVKFFSSFFSRQEVSAGPLMSRLTWNSRCSAWYGFHSNVPSLLNTFQCLSIC